MSGKKRSWEGHPKEIERDYPKIAPLPASTMDQATTGKGEEDEPTPSSTMAMFTAYRKELEEHQDRRERIIKASRDITALSKKKFVLW